MAEQLAPTAHIYGRKDFAWRECPDGWALRAIGHRSAIVHVVPDGVWPGMWRIRYRDGRLSDMANLSWARDSAVAAAMRLLDPRRQAEQSVSRAPPMRPAGWPQPSLLLAAAENLAG